jgi:hypothetical protein
VDRRVDRVAGVVDDDVELAPGVERGAHERLGRLRLRQVAAEYGRLTGDLGRGLRCQIRVEVVDDHFRAVLAQQLGRRAADAARRSGDDRHLVVEDSHGRAT